MKNNSSKPEISWFTRFKVALAALAFAGAAVAGTTAMSAPDSGENEQAGRAAISVSIGWGDDGGVSYSRSVTWS